MNKATKRMLLAYDGGEDDREMINRRDYRSEYRNGYRNDYRDEYENAYHNEYAYGNNMRYEYDEPEDKYDRRGRRHYKNGRYAPMNSYDDPMEYQDRDLRNIGAMSTMRMIGFDGASALEILLKESIASILLVIGDFVPCSFFLTGGSFSPTSSSTLIPK